MLSIGSNVIPNHEYGVWVGFNDINPFIPNTHSVFCTGSKNWHKPPRLGETAEILVFDALLQSGTVIGHTTAINYPIGARTQCVQKDGAPFYLINNSNGGIPCLETYNSSFECIEILPKIHHWCTTNDFKYSICCDFNNSQRLGGYGYLLPNLPLTESHYYYPRSISLYSYDNCSHEEIVSLAEVVDLVAKYLKISPTDLIKNAYLTHPLLSPSETKLAFLFRSWLRDGGILTSLLFVDSFPTKSRKVKLLLVGQLSHFTWLSDDKLLIYAYQLLDSNSPRVRINYARGLKYFTKATKSAFKLVRSAQSVLKHLHSPVDSYGNESFDSKFSQKLPCFVSVNVNTKAHGFLPFPLPACDGHPSVSDKNNSKILISDTYPNILSTRRVFSVDLDSGDLLHDQLVTEYAPKNIPIYNWISQGLALPRYADFSKKAVSFTRSGLHCDAHPFFNEDASVFGYHTSADGYRTIKTKIL